MVIEDLTEEEERLLFEAIRNAWLSGSRSGSYRYRCVQCARTSVRLAADPVLVPGEPARDHLTTTASDLITALEASEPG